MASHIHIEKQEDGTYCVEIKKPPSLETCTAMTQQELIAVLRDWVNED